MKRFKKLLAYIKWHAKEKLPSLVVLVAIMYPCLYVLGMTGACIPPTGTKLSPTSEWGHKADGILDSEEADLLIRYSKEEIELKIKGRTKHALIMYAVDMHIFIRKYLLPNWKGINGLYLHVVEDGEGMEKSWKHCTQWEPTSFNILVSGFYCWLNGEITIPESNFENSVDTYDHEEGHHINPLEGEVEEFTAEFNKLWKGLIRMAMHAEFGAQFVPAFTAKVPSKKDKRTIKSIGRYRSGLLMFFMVMNHYNGDLVKPAKFIFNSNERTLKKFFYKRLNSYHKRLNVEQIWVLEVTAFFDNKNVKKNIKALRRRARKDRGL